MKKLTFIFALVFFFSSYSQSQLYKNYFIEWSGEQEPCPGTEYTYTITGYVQTSTGTDWTEIDVISNWDVTGGTITGGGANQQGTIKVKWDDEKFDDYEITVDVRFIDYPWGGQWTEYYDVYPYTLKDCNPTHSMSSLSIDKNDVSPKTITINPIEYPNGTETSIYKWVIPSGWKHSGTTSDGSTPFTTSSSSISIVPDDCTGGTVIVYGENDQCSNKSNSNSLVMTFSRPWPNSYITGDNVVCSSKQYTLNNLPNDAIINWSSGVELTRSSSQGSNPCTFSKNGGSSGLSYVGATVSTTCGTDYGISDYNAWVGNPDPADFYIEAVDIYGNDIDIGGSFEVCEGECYTFYLYPFYNLPSAHHKYGITSTSFYFDFDYEIVDEGDGWAYVYVNSFDQESTGLVDVEACSSLAEFYVFDLVEGMCGGYFMSLSPNPSNGEVVITLESTSEKRTLDTNEPWELEVRDQSLNLKYKKTKLKGKIARLNTSSWVSSN